MKILKLIVPCAVAVTLTACVTGGTSTATEPLPIRIINAETAKKCTFLGVANGTATNVLTYVQNNINKARAQAAEQAVASGGNAGVITDTDIASHGHVVTISMDYYNCSS